MYKKGIPGYDFVCTAGYAVAMDNFDSYPFIIGHNRLASIGGKGANSSHPFQHGNITLVHNGTIRNPYQLYKGYGKFAVDSEALCYAISTEGAEDVLPKIEGSYAIIWHDKSTGKMYLARNSERPLHFAVANKGKEIYITSEFEHLIWLTSRIVGIDIDETYYIDEDVIYEFTAGNLANYKQIAKVPKKTYRISYAPTSSSSSNNNNNVKDIMGVRKRRKDETDYLKNVGTILKRHNLSLDKTIAFTPISFVPYNPYSSLGTMVCICETKAVAVKLHCVPNNKAEDLLSLPTGRVLSGIINHAVATSKTTITINVQYNSVKQIDIKHKKTTEDSPCFPGPDGSTIAPSIFNKLVSYGCCFCGVDIDESEADEVVYIPQDHGGGVVCGACCLSLQPKVKNNMAIEFPEVK